MLKMMLLHPNLAANAKVVFEFALCDSLLINTLTYALKHSTYMNILNHIFNSD